MSVAAVTRALGVGWNSVNNLAAIIARELVFDCPWRLGGVRYLGIDERKWKHRRGHGDPDFVTVIVDLTSVIDGTRPARLLDMVAGRSAEALSNWLAKREENIPKRVKVVAMDGFAGHHNATAAALPSERAVIDPLPCAPGRGEAHSESGRSLIPLGISRQTSPVADRRPRGVRGTLSWHGLPAPGCRTG